MKIAVDIDDVLTSSAEQLAAYLRASGWPGTTRDGFWSYHIEDILGCDRATALDILAAYHQSPFHADIQPKPDALALLHELGKSHEFVAVTARHNGQENETLDFMHRHFPQISETIFLYRSIEERSFDSKAEICAQIAAQLLIDDNVDHVVACAKTGIAGLLYTAPWNESFIEQPLVRRVNDWSGIRDILTTQ